MPPDIRTFFTPRNGTAGLSQKQSKPSPAATRKAAAKKRRIVIDSDDDEDEAPPKKPSPSKRSNKKENEKNVKEEEITTSAYFSKSGKNKISRTVPVRPAKPKSVKPLPKEDKYFDDDDENATDIFEEAFKKLDDDYQEEPQDEDMDDFVVPDESEEDVKPKKTPAKAPAKAGKKRKSLSNDEESEEEVKPKKKTAKTAQAKKTPTTKRAPPKPKAAVEENSEIQKILDNIPTVRAPSPPAQNGDQKFNFRATLQRDDTASGEALEAPTGADNCLAGLSFVFTGVLDGISREAGQQLVKRHGGKVMTAPSSKTSYVVLGSEAGPKKLETIKKFGLKTIDEHGLFALIRSLPANGGDSSAAKANEAKKAAEEKKVAEMIAEMDRTEKEQTKKIAKAAKVANSPQGPMSRPIAPPPDPSSQLWTVKYAPTSMTQICGNKGHVEKLQRWLKNWPKNLKFDFKKRGEDGSGGYRAAMIHGPPGIGKTTAAHLVAKLEGYDVLEFNASDTRSKKLMEDTMRGVLNNTSIKGYFAADNQKVDLAKKKLVLIMDEVDGMSAGDRGGVGALATFCRKTSIPIICICNERRLPKMKPFDGVTMDMPFRRPDAMMIRSRIMTIAVREGLKLPPTVIDQLVEGTHSDIRQIINMLSTYKTTASSMDYDQSRDLSKQWQKHVVFKPWDIAEKLLGYDMFGPNANKTLNDKMELYFNDHEFSYLMVQENYLKTRPDRASKFSGREQKLKLLELADNAAHSISDGDLVDRMIHGTQQQWSLMPTHGMFSTVIPSSYTYGARSERMGFASWLGMNSRQGKLSRLVKEIQSHMRLRTSGDRHEVRQQYLPSFFNMLVRRLEAQGKDSIGDIIDMMDQYYLTREDFDAIQELGVGPMDQSTVDIPAVTKAAFTRMYNLMSHPMPFMKASSVGGLKAAKKDVPDTEDVIIESEDEAEPDKVEDDDSDLSKDKYVKQPKKKAASKAAGKGKAVVDKAATKAPAKAKAAPKKKAAAKK